MNGLLVRKVDCKTVGFFLKISKEIGKAWRENLTRAKHASLTRLSPVSLSVFSLVPHLLFDCSRVLEYAKIRTVLQSIRKENFRLSGKVELNRNKYLLLCVIKILCV